jgi:large subunit ribosomal protein L21e
MPHTNGYRGSTRKIFSKAFRKHGTIPLSRYLVNLRRGDFVDIKADSAVQKGMPHKLYHGRTGRIFNVTQHAVGVIVNKRVKHRIFAKRIHVRVEHVAKSNCQKAHLKRVEENDARKRAGDKSANKRAHELPREEHLVVTGATEIVDQLPPLRVPQYA